MKSCWLSLALLCACGAHTAAPPTNIARMLYVVPEALPREYRWQIRGEAVTLTTITGARLNAQGEIQGAPRYTALPAGKQLLVGLTSVSAGVAVLTQPEVSNQSAAALQRLLKEHQDAHGIQLDFEYLPPAQAENFVRYIKLLRTALPANTTIHVAVFPPVGMPLAWSAFHRLPELVQAADGIVVMLYDHYRAGTGAGCVSGIRWLDQNAEALSALPREKIWLGAPLYGYRFQEKKAVAISHKGFQKIAASERNHDGCRIKTTATGSAYYPSPELYAHYDTLVRRHGFAGVAYWRAGLEL